MPVKVGLQITGAAEGKALLAKVGEAGNVWASSRIGVSVGVPYAYWIERGRYFGGRSGAIRNPSGGYRYAEKAMADVLPSIRGMVAESLLEGGAGASKTAEAISARLAERMRAYQPAVSGRLRGSTQPFRGGGIRDVTAPPRGTR